MPLKRRLVLIASPYSLVDPPALYEPGRLDHTPSVNHDSRVFSPIYFCCIPCDTTYTKESASVVSNALLDKTVFVVGLGYVGLPLAEAFSRHLKTIWYRRNQKAVDELNATPGNRIEAIICYC